jgi:hypothetical protein
MRIRIILREKLQETPIFMEIPDFPVDLGLNQSIEKIYVLITCV